MVMKHGVYNSEQPTSLTTPLQGSAGLQVVFGTAPVHLAANPRAAANTPKLCYSFAECVQALGYSDDFAKFSLCQSMDASFRVFNVAPVILVNVLDPDNPKHITENEAKDYNVSGGQVVYDLPFVLLDTLVINHGDNQLAAGVDYQAVHNEDGTVCITLLSDTASAAQSLNIASKSLKPSGVTGEDIVGGVNSLTGAESGLELIRQIYPMFNLVPGLLLAPGWAEQPLVAAALQAKSENINGSFNCANLIDIPTGGAYGAKVYTGVKGAKEAIGAQDSRTLALWPRLAIGDKQYAYSAIMGALLAYNDAQNGDVPYDSPSNKSLRVTNTVLADGTKVMLDQEQGNFLNSLGVITAINANGFKAWGNKTAAYPGTTDPKDSVVATRRFFDWDGNNFIMTYLQKVDRPANKRLIQSIVDSQNIIGNGYVARDYCAGYRVEFRAEENPVTELLNGHLTLRTFLAPYLPAEFIEDVREYDVKALQAALTGGGE